MVCYEFIETSCSMAGQAGMVWYLCLLFGKYYMQ